MSLLVWQKPDIVFAAKPSRMVNVRTLHDG
jgi:hypothetical protein